MFLGCSSTKATVKADLYSVTFIDGPPESGLEMCLFPETGGDVQCIKYETFLAAKQQRDSAAYGNTTDL
jgi:hypothetical protein